MERVNFGDMRITYPRLRKRPCKKRMRSLKMKGIRKSNFSSKGGISRPLQFTNVLVNCLYPKTSGKITRKGLQPLIFSNANYILT